jgi:hypothetical protein
VAPSLLPATCQAEVLLGAEGLFTLPLPKGDLLFDVSPSLHCFACLSLRPVCLHGGLRH